MINSNDLNKFMSVCIELAKTNWDNDQYPIAAVVINSDGSIISTSSSNLRKKNDPTNHPEMEAIRNASDVLNSRFLRGCYLFTTLEPCPMCTSAAIWAKMQGIVFGAYQEDAINYVKTHNAQFSWRQIQIKSRDIINRAQPRLEIYEGILRNECGNLFK